jgi:iron complex outermembrane receptor protein
MKNLIDILHREGCSLVVEKDGEVSIYNQKGVRDLEHLLKCEPEKLRGARIADKVIGKAAAALMVQGGVVEAYAEVLSRKALPLLEAADVFYVFGELVDGIVIPEGDDRCPLEQIVGPALTAAEAEQMLRRHFEMNQRMK